MSKIQSIAIKRCITIGISNASKYELITFTDASKDAYSAAVYLRISNGISTKVDLVFSKSRLAPMKMISIPRLELLGVLIGCRASHFVASQMKINGLSQTILTDSKCVIAWCKTKRELKRFVVDKVKEIRSYNIKLGYVRSEDNPADLACRGARLKKLIKNHMWWHGPEWLTTNDDVVESQTYEINEETRNAVNSEEKGPEVLHEIGIVADEDLKKTTPFEINETQFSSHTRLIRVTAWCTRFINNLKKSNIQGCLSGEELANSLKLWTRSIQEIHFAEESEAILKNKNHSVRLNLGVRKDENGILRCHGRFGTTVKSPKLLPKKSHYTDMIIKRDHRRMLHAGVAQTLSEIRNEHWIIQGRSAVQRVIRQCLICIFWEGGPFKTPPFAPLPNYVTDGSMKPFSFVGLDYLGPLCVRQGEGFIKHWICLFTCIEIRAIHLELVINMNTDKFLMCLRRFIARRGKPAMIISDNANQFKLGNSVIDKIWGNIISHTDVQSYISNEGIKWKFVIDYAPWKGGFYERLVGITKRSLKKSLGRSKVNEQQLSTVLVETEAVINRRPLVYVENDINSRALTPADFLTMNYYAGIPDIEIDYSPEETSGEKLLKIWKRGQDLLNYFWKVWSTEYLQSLREKHTLKMKAIKGEVQREPKVGEIVIVKEEGIPRGSWKLAKIQSLIYSEVDDVPRAASLISSSGRNFKRPFRLLYPLENTNYDEAQNRDIEVPLKEVINEKTNKRPTRIAASKARKRIRDNATANVGGSVDNISIG